MNRIRKLYDISNEDEDNIENTNKSRSTNYVKKMKVKDIPNNRLVNSKNANGFNRKFQIKKSYHIWFPSSKSKMNSIFITSLLKILVFLVRLALKNFIQIQVTLIVKRT